MQPQKIRSKWLLKDDFPSRDKLFDNFSSQNSLFTEKMPLTWEQNVNNQQKLNLNADKCDKPYIQLKTRTDR